MLEIWYIGMQVPILMARGQHMVGLAIIFYIFLFSNIWNVKISENRASQNSKPNHPPDIGHVPLAYFYIKPLK